MNFYKDLIGIKYKDQGRNKEEGFDCYGLAIEVLKRNGIILEDRIKNPKEGNLNLIEIENPEKLCIIEYDLGFTESHIAVYIGDGMIIHTTKRYGVVIEPMYKYSYRQVGCFKVR